MGSTENNNSENVNNIANAKFGIHNKNESESENLREKIEKIYGLNKKSVNNYFGKESLNFKNFNDEFFYLKNVNSKNCTNQNSMHNNITNTNNNSYERLPNNSISCNNSFTNS